MEKEIINRLNKTFEESAYVQDGVEYWLARELQVLLDYAQWRNFLNAVEKAKQSCKTTGETVADHFADVSKMVRIERGRSIIVKHTAKIFSEGELEEKSNVQFLHNAKSDKPMKFYNLNVSISVEKIIWKV